MGRLYASVEQYVARCGPAPAEAELLLARASDDVAAALITAVYDPALDDVAGTLVEAVCAQVEYWLATGSDGITTGEAWDAVSIGPVSLSGRSAPAASPVLVAGVELAPRAYRALHLAGLLPGEVTDEW
ncbi:hypothetical protein [Streptomyces kronopolitis]|uniref:hypothetical protein n=1 Tax=Streptomyces kronopolitis TaxID=1612435 RepID=UPI0020BDCB07|nr:hypothetical protein [Streptomyces kronopolitis]MCL6302827.1 hypothetical protein [Streptomyces kronopolitis]